MNQTLTYGAPALAGPEAARRSSCAGPLLGILLAGAAVRIALLFWFQGEPLFIHDERDYNQLARNLVRHGQFAYTWADFTGDADADTADTLLPTSLRPPLYPAFVAVVYGVFGLDNYQAVRAGQLVLSLLTVLGMYALGKEVYDHRIGLAAAGLYGFYPSLLVYNNLLLTEVLFTFLLVTACLCVARGFRRDSVAWLVTAGALIGLAALTRSVLWLFPPVLAVVVLLAWKGPLGRRALAAVGMAAAFAVVIAPWTVRNSRLQQSFVTIDVMSGRNFMMGNYEYTPLARSWDAISMQGKEAWDHVLREANPGFGQLTQGQIDKLALRHGLAFVRENPGLTAKRDAIKLVQFWGLERELVSGAAEGLWGLGEPPAESWKPSGQRAAEDRGKGPSQRVLLPLAVVLLGAYVLAMFSGAFGMIMIPPPDRRVHLFLLVLIAFVWGLHVLAFAHSRYHLPLMPLVLLYAAAAVVHRREIWRQRWGLRFGLAAGVCGLFVLAWCFEVVIVDLEKIRHMVGA